MYRIQKGYVPEIIWSRVAREIIVHGALLIKGLSVVHGEDARRFWSYQPYVRAILKLSKSRLLSSGRTILLFKHVYFHVKEATYLTKSWSEANHSEFLDDRRLSFSNCLVLYESYSMTHTIWTHIIWVIYYESWTGLACSLNRIFFKVADIVESTHLTGQDPQVY